MLMEWLVLLPVLPLLFIALAGLPHRQGDPKPRQNDWERRALKVRRYYEKNPGRHDAASVAARFGFTVGTVHDIRAGRQSDGGRLWQGPVQGWE
jgi:hypothetical protein